MLSILMLPFMCLPLAGGEKLEAEKTPSNSLNELTSVIGNEELKTSEYKQAWANKVAKLSNIAHHNEGSSNNDALLNAEKLEFGSKADAVTRSAIMLEGTLSSSDTVDSFYFNVPDRSYVWVNFLNDHQTSVGEVLAEEPRDSNPKLFDIGDDSTRDPTATLKKGAYYIRLMNPDKLSVEYRIRIMYMLAEDYTVTFDDEFMKNNNVLVWESDFLPKNSTVTNGRILYEKGTGLLNTSTKKWLPIRSCTNKYEGIYRYICVWKNEHLKQLAEEFGALDKKLIALEQKLKNAQMVFKVIEKTVDVLGKVSCVIGLYNASVSSKLDSFTTASTLILSAIGNGVKVDYNTIRLQIHHYLGVFDAATDGTVVTFREQAYVDHDYNRSRHGSLTIDYLRFKPYLENNTSYNVVIQKADSKGFKLSSRLNVDGANLSECQGTFRLVNSLEEIKPLYSI